jgi:hypothetical protein
MCSDAADTKFVGLMLYFPEVLRKSTVILKTAAF